MANLDFETAVHLQTSIEHIAGLDEAGRGSIAGPVVAGAVILPLLDSERLARLEDVNDSKQLSAITRERLYQVIIDNATTYGIGMCSAAQVDEMGIIPATKLAMITALSQLEPVAGYLLIDGRIRLKSIPVPQQAIIRGDSKSLSIAAASILAKVSRDRFMIEQAQRYPGYGFARHKGYGTRAHMAALELTGPSPIHRRTFAPLRKTLL